MKCFQCTSNDPGYLYFEYFDIKNANQFSNNLIKNYFKKINKYTVALTLKLGVVLHITTLEFHQRMLLSNLLELCPVVVEKK